MNAAAASVPALLTGRADAVRCRLLLEERVAQPVEHLTFNQEVMGSSPIALTKKSGRKSVSSDAAFEDVSVDLPSATRGRR
jgi:hypothetical protein